MATTLYDDRDGQYPADYVPGYGVVYWSEHAKDVAAGQFASTHRPNARMWSLKGLTRRRFCLFCELPWSQCHQSTWARRRLRGKAAVPVTWVGEW